jgi:hypothetical protein
MSIRVNSVTFANELRPQTTTWLLGNRKDKITCTIDYTVETVATASNDNPFILNNNDGFPGPSTYIISSNNNDFQDFRVGDTLLIYDYVNNVVIDNTKTIVAVLDSNNIQLSGGVGSFGFNVVRTNVAIWVTTPIKGHRFKWNLIENNTATNYNSFLTNQLQEVIVEEKLASDVTISNMLFMGGKEWQDGSVTIQGLGINSTNTYTSSFRLVHTFFVENWNKFADDLDRYLNGNCLKYIYDLTALYEFTNPNRLQQTFTDEVLGNVGNYNENFNNRPTNYSISGLSYSTGTEVELIDTETNFEFFINNTVDAPFSNNNTKFVLHFSRVPNNQFYENNGKNINENFWNDRLLQTVGSAAINGDNYATNRRIFKQVSATFINSSQIRINGKIELGAQILSDAPGSYTFSVSVQNHTLNTANADKVTLLIDEDNFFINTTDANMIVSNLRLLKHPKNDLNDSTTNVTSFRYDELVNYTQFYIDRLTREADEIVLTELIHRVYATNGTQRFNLDSFSYNLSNLGVINGHQFINFSLPRPFKIPTNEPRKNIIIRRRTDLDTADNFYYDFAYPFLVRWEYWVALAGVNGAFFNQAQPNNGFNQDWFPYDNLATWDIFVETEIRATKNGALQSYRSQTQLEVKDYLSNPDFINESLVSRRTSDNVNLNGYILAYEDNYLEARFEINSGTFNLSNAAVVFSLEQFGVGGQDGRERASSVYAIASDSLFKGAVTLSLDSGDTVLKAVVPIDIAKFQQLQGQFTVVARLYYPAFVPMNTKQFQDSENVLFQNNELYLFQNV